MSRPLSFQQVLLKLHDFWAAQGCVIWEPYNVQLGAGTGNPATLLRALGPEPWRVAYVEPTVRPDDGRFGENPNRMQKYYQYQVLLKPEPGNPQELYLESLAALGISQRDNDIRFVEDNWESPALGAWGLGWEVWLNGQEISQFTYFQQAGGMTLDPVSVELTYGIERIVLALQGVASAWDISWTDGISYGDIMRSEEIEHCRYYFELADVAALKAVYDTYEREYARALEGDALIAAYDYVLKCSHLFNVLDTRGAIGVTERAHFFRRMRAMTREIAQHYVAQREALGFPLMKMAEQWRGAETQTAAPMPAPLTEAHDLLIEIGVEELPPADVDAAEAQVKKAAPALLADLRLEHGAIDIVSTPRRIGFIAKAVAPRQKDERFIAKGPPADRAFDAAGEPTRAAQGFARSKGITVDALRIAEMDGGRYVTAEVHKAGLPTAEALAAALPGFIASIKFDKTMRWNASGVEFSRPIRWIVALFGDAVIPFEYAGVASGGVTRRLRQSPLPLIQLDSAADQRQILEDMALDSVDRQSRISEEASASASRHGGRLVEDAALLAETANLVEAPTVFHGEFDRAFLDLPRPVLETVMRKHQRYFAVEDNAGKLMNHFIGVGNGEKEPAAMAQILRGNEQVLRARFADARFFYQEDRKKPLRDFLPRLETLTFQEQLGSVRQKNDRVAGMIDALGALLQCDAADIAIAREAAALAKADLATNMVIELTSLQGVMGREYALREGVAPAVAQAIYEHWLPRGEGDALPASAAGSLLAIGDKMDSLAGLFAVGLMPTSSSDPYGLRRAALGVIRILLEHEILVDLRALIALAAERQPVACDAAGRGRLLEFMLGRFSNWLQEANRFPRDVVRAVLKGQAPDPVRALKGMRQLSQQVRQADWEAHLDSFARCARITRGEAPQPLDPDRLNQSAEIRLHQAYLRAAARLDADGSVASFLQEIYGLAPLVADFFDTVLVHSDDPALRNNRIALLQRISALQQDRVDLSQLENF